MILCWLGSWATGVPTSLAKVTMRLLAENFGWQAVSVSMAGDEGGFGPSGLVGLFSSTQESVGSTMIWSVTR